MVMNNMEFFFCNNEKFQTGATSLRITGLSKTTIR